MAYILIFFFFLGGGGGRILKWVAEEENELAKGRVQAVILDMSNLMNVDTSGILILEELHKRLLSRGVQLAMVNPRWLVIHKLKVAHFVDKIGRQWVFLTVAEAVDAFNYKKWVMLFLSKYRLS
ncbi:Low affinity sulfate transporter 3 [Glycine soja]|uniref:Low affinity sulfate transporter 3 n=2 Tax=Glycine subgen. Soja TaxID=1462606 RepID=A0A445KSA5_GLYSO|nr:Low affinity sulfate transporter 3 [Glycine soja]